MGNPDLDLIMNALSIVEDDSEEDSISCAFITEKDSNDFGYNLGYGVDRDFNRENKHVIDLTQKLREHGAGAHKEVFDLAFQEFLNYIVPTLPVAGLSSKKLRNMYNIGFDNIADIDHIHLLVEEYTEDRDIFSLRIANNALVEYMVGIIHAIDSINSNLNKPNNGVFLKNPLTKYVIIGSSIELYIQDKLMMQAKQKEADVVDTAVLFVPSLLSREIVH